MGNHQCLKEEILNYNFKNTLLRLAHTTMAIGANTYCQHGYQ